MSFYMVLERALDKVCGAVYKIRLEAQGVPGALFHSFWTQRKGRQLTHAHRNL